MRGRVRGGVSVSYVSLELIHKHTELCISIIIICKEEY